MPHGSHRVGSLEIVALCDGITQSSLPLEEKFPGAGDWAAYRRAFPEYFTEAGDRWRFHVHAFLIRTGDATVLVDTGIGPPGGPLPEWAGSNRGHLPEELAAAGVAPEAVDVVVLTHVHDDHFGGFTGADGTVAFPNARHLMHRADWDALHEDPEDEVYLRHSFEPVREAGLLDLIEDGHDAAPGITLLHTPGHTPGHLAVSIESEGERALVAGDVLLHPAQIADRFSSDSDDDATAAEDTRERLLSRAEREATVLSLTHLTEPFGRIELDEGRRVWRPLA